PAAQNEDAPGERRGCPEGYSRPPPITEKVYEQRRRSIGAKGRRKRFSPENGAYWIYAAQVDAERRKYSHGYFAARSRITWSLDGGPSRSSTQQTVTHWRRACHTTRRTGRSCSVTPTVAAPLQVP